MGLCSAYTMYEAEMRTQHLWPLILACAALPAGISAQTKAEPSITLEQRSTIRCAAAFAIVAQGQANGNKEALAYPPLTQKGREFFVRSSARLMDETGMDRAAVAALMQKEAQALWDKGEIEQIMPSCLLLLEASGI